MYNKEYYTQFRKYYGESKKFWDFLKCNIILLLSKQNKKRVLRLARTIAPNDEALLEFLKKRDVLQQGKQKKMSLA